jgi:hypothetical protein
MRGSIPEYEITANAVPMITGNSQLQRNHGSAIQNADIIYYRSIASAQNSLLVFT